MHFKVFSLFPRTGIRAFLESCLPLHQSKRLRSKINIQKPRAPHFLKAKYLEFGKPFYPSLTRNKAPVELCQKSVNLYPKETGHPYQQIIAREIYQSFVNSRLVAFFHTNCISVDDRFKAYALFKKQDMILRQIGRETLEVAVKGTRYETILGFYVSHNNILFSPEPQIAPMLKIAKKFPQLVLLAAIFEGEFINKDQIIEYSLIPDLPAAQAGLVHVLNGIGGQLVNNMTTHQNTLVSHLQERIKQLEEDK